VVETVTLYRAPTTPADADALAEWLRGRIDATVRVWDRLLGVVDDDGLPEELAAARVTDPSDPDTGNTMVGIVRYEERALSAPERAGGVVYDGHAVQRALNARLPDERGLDHLHIPLLDRVIGTWGTHDGRWHKRVAVLGQPALVSVPGLYEAPAKPAAYYEAKSKHALLTGDAPPREVLEAELEGDFLVADDPRTTEALRGYVLAAVNLLESGGAFCEDERCRLHDAHRQPGVLRAQLRDPPFCETHAERYG
jgi:type IV secretory pathway protease TraF